jgi:hypothetical protein
MTKATIRQASPKRISSAVLCPTLGHQRVTNRNSPRCFPFWFAVPF